MTVDNTMRKCKKNFHQLKPKNKSSTSVTRFEFTLLKVNLNDVLNRTTILIPILNE